MKCSEIAELLLKTPDAQVLVKVSNDWVEVFGVKATGQHRNAVTLDVSMPGMNGVMVVEPDVSNKDAVSAAARKGFSGA